MFTAQHVMPLFPLQGKKCLISENIKHNTTLQESCNGAAHFAILTLWTLPIIPSLR
jgi:hypothetical protein